MDLLYSFILFTPPAPHMLLSFLHYKFRETSPHKTPPKGRVRNTHTQGMRLCTAYCDVGLNCDPIIVGYRNCGGGFVKFMHRPFRGSNRASLQTRDSTLKSSY